MYRDTAPLTSAPGPSIVGFMIQFILTAAVAFLTLFSCGGQKIQSVDRENLFTLNLGKMEDQIDLFGLEGNRSARKTCLYMRDGIFYISDGNGSKVVKYTSYGDLLSMIYNGDTNPPPLTLKTEAPNQELVTRRAIAYPLNEPGELAVDSRKHLYVEDRLPPDRRSFDAEKRTIMDSTVLHFDGDGHFVDYWGQEGIGGTPFPRISGIFTSVHDEVAVVCRLSTGWNIFWFDQNGTVLYLIKIKNEDLPIPKDRKSRPSLDSISVAPDSRSVYLKIDYYRDSIDESTKTKSGIAYDGSIIWIMNAETGAYTGSVDVPVFEQETKENDKKVTVDLIYSMLGVVRGGKIFLSVPTAGGYSLLLLESDSKNQKRGFIQVSDDELAFNAFHLSSDGILSALLATNLEARVVWWRTDRFIGDPRK